MDKSGIRPFGRVAGYMALSEDQCQKVHEATLDVLEQTGVQIEEAESLELLHGAGADIGDKQRVKIPAAIVERAIKLAPSEVLLFDRNGKEAMSLGGSRVYFGAHGDCPDILDPLTGTRRRYLAKDGATVARVCDQLANIDFVSLNGFAADCPNPAAAAPLIFKEMVSNTTKPLGFSCADTEVYNDVLEIGRIVAGGEEELRRRPFFYHYCEPTTPLVHTSPSLRRLIKSVDSGIPLVYTPMPMAGATAPCSFAGTLVVGNAEVLTGLVIAQLRRPGAPCIYGGIPGIMDMKTTIFSYGAPEMHLMVTAMTDLAHYYKLPMFGTAGCTDAKCVDQQAAVEATLSCHAAVTSGANLVHDVGLIDHADLVSTEMIVLCDEIIGMIKQTCSAVEVTQDALVTDLIRQVGPGGNYLTNDHTLENFRRMWFPSLMDRTRGGNDPNSKQRRESFSERLNRKTRSIMAAHQPESLPAHVQKELSALAKNWGKS